MANKTYNSPLFLTGGIPMPTQDGDIYIPVSKDGRLGTGQIYDEFRTWFYNPDVQENLLESYKECKASDILDMYGTGSIPGFEPDKPSSWESLLE